MIYKTIDLCAGIGGIRRGFELTGSFQNVRSAEIDESAAKTYKHLFDDDALNDLTSEEFKTELDSTEYDVLLAGFPCQAFSRAGKQLGFRDTTRGTIFFDIADIISRTKPRAIFLENVDNLISHDHGNTINTIVKTLEDELDYRVIGVSLDENGNYQYDRSSFVRNSKNFGVPQNRARAYIMAFSKKKYGNAIKLLTEQLPTESTEVMLNCFDILEQQQEEIVKALAYQNAYITKKAVMENLGINAVQASAILKKLIEQQEIRRISHGVSTRYVNANREDDLPPFSQEEKVLEYAKENDSFSNKDIVELLQITVGSGNVLLSTMVKKGLLIRVKRGWYSAKV